MLYPKEDPSSNLLMFACRSCQYSEPATAACIYRNALQEQIAETAGNVEDVAQDPTVSHSSHDFAKDSFMGDGIEDMDSDDDDIPEMCTLCGQEILCPFCGLPSDAHMALEVDDPDRAQNGEQEEELVKAEQRERAASTVAS
jgi:DNA-directed RNA polymerase II subunit RPB9